MLTRLRRGMPALFVLVFLAGCGGGLGFTGGSIPPGGTRMFGRVSASENPLMPLAHVTIDVVSQPVSGGSRAAKTTTGTDGSFDFFTVPTGATYATFTVTVTPDPSLGRQPQQIVFRADNGRTDDLVVTLPLASVDPAKAKTLTVQDIPSLPPGDTAAVHARLLDASGRRLPLQPTLLFAGNFGSIAIDETFAASVPGTGSITAFWYALPSVSTSVTVDPAAPHLPPSPPDLPPASITGEPPSTSP